MLSGDDNMIMKYCTKCGTLMQYNGKSLCAVCQQKREEQRKAYRNKEKDKIYNQKYRNKKTDKFYHSKEWKNLSRAILAKANYQCALCGKLAVEVHHIEEVADNWEKRFDIDNLMPLCTSCHNKQRKTRGRGG